MEVLEEKANDVFNRKELVVALESEAGTPSRQFVTSEVCKKLVVSEDCVVIDSILQRFGRKLVKARVKVYSSPEDLKKFEPAYRKARPHPKKAKEAVKAEKAAAKAPAKPAEAPAKQAEKKAGPTEEGKPAEKEKPAEAKPEGGETKPEKKPEAEEKKEQGEA